MSTFIFSCPVCHQHVQCDSHKGGSVVECPTCFQRVVAPQASTLNDSKIIPAGRRYTEKTIPVSAAPKPSQREEKSVPVGLIIVGVVALAAIGGAGYFFLGPKSPKLLNPSFESPPTSNYSYAPAGDPWQYSARNGENGAGISADHGDFTAGNPPVPDGRQTAFLQGVGSSISQVVSGFSPGKHYTITFNAAQRANWGSLTGQSWNVTVNGLVIKSFSPPQEVTEYAVYTAEFTADTSVSTITFIATDIHGGDNTIFIDNVRITSP